MLAGGMEADGVASSQRLALLRTALVFDSAPQVQEIAAQAVCDLALLRCSTHIYSQLWKLWDAPRHDAPNIVLALMQVLHYSTPLNLQIKGGPCQNYLRDS